MKKNILLTLIIFAVNLRSGAQYYNTAFGLNGTPLRSALHNIIKNHNVLSYADLWSAFQQTDKKPNNTVWDIYTDIPGGNPATVYQFVTDQCGNYNAEGDCYNREHSWPSSYFADAYPMYSDLHHIFPTDGWINNKHGNDPLGDVNNMSYTSFNGTKTGTGLSYTGYNGALFEPVDSFKGDLARAYFYMNTRYENEDAGWANWEMANGATLTSDAVTLLMNWHHADPVSQKETDRNNAIAILQTNRNPFIDYPLFADCIWGNADCTSIGLPENFLSKEFKIYPLPVSDEMQIEWAVPVSFAKISVFDLSGREVLYQQYPDRNTAKETLRVSSLHDGNYLLLIRTSKGVIKKMFSKN